MRFARGGRVLRGASPRARPQPFPERSPKLFTALRPRTADWTALSREKKGPLPCRTRKGDWDEGFSKTFGIAMIALYCTLTLVLWIGIMTYGKVRLCTRDEHLWRPLKI